MVNPDTNPKAWDTTTDIHFLLLITAKNVRIRHIPLVAPHGHVTTVAASGYPIEVTLNDDTHDRSVILDDAIALIHGPEVGAAR